MKCVLLVALVAAPAVAILNLKSDACETEDLKHRVQLQNKLAGDCEEMCKEVGAYPKKCTCPDFVQPDATPGVMTWEELLGHMDNLVAWGKESLKGWASQAAGLLQQTAKAAATTIKGAVSSKACTAQDLKHRAQVQNKLATACEDMCKEVGAYPKCECPGFAPPDSTPGVMTWEELLEHMDNLEAWGLEMIKKAKARAASSLLQNKTDTKVSAKASLKIASNATTGKGNATKGKKACSVTVTFSGGQDADTSKTFDGGCHEYMSEGVYSEVTTSGTAGAIVEFYKSGGCTSLDFQTYCCSKVAAPKSVQSIKIGGAC